MTLCLTCRNEHCCVEQDLRKIRSECEYYRPITNADRIRNMTDEELAAFASELGCHPSASAQTCRGVANCAECWLDWLKQEAE